MADMNPPSREEIAARMEAVEARIETRLVGIESKIDKVLDQVGVAIKSADKAEHAAQGALGATITTRWHLLFMVLGGVAAIVAILAMGVQVLELAASIFQAGLQGSK